MSSREEGSRAMEQGWLSVNQDDELGTVEIRG